MAAPPPPPNLGGTGSAEHTRALAFNGGMPRRNSINEGNAIHALVPAGPAGGTVTAAQLEALRGAGGAVGRVPSGGLMALIPPGSEQNYRPTVGAAARPQLRTGRNFSVPDTAGGAPFTIRVHTNDPNHAPPSNSGSGPVLRITQGTRSLMTQAMPHPTHPAINPVADWAAPGLGPAALARGGFPPTANDARANAAHIPFDMPAAPVLAPPIAPPLAPPLAPPIAPPLAPPIAGPAPHGGGFLPPIGAVVNGVGNAVWHGSGASQLVGGAQQFYRNSQPGGTWGGMAMGAVRMAAGGAMLGAIASTAPARATAAAAVSVASRVTGLWR